MTPLDVLHGVVPGGGEAGAGEVQTGEEQARTVLVTQIPPDESVGSFLSTLVKTCPQGAVTTVNHVCDPKEGAQLLSKEADLKARLEQAQWTFETKSKRPVHTTHIYTSPTDMLERPNAQKYFFVILTSESISEFKRARFRQF